MVFSKYATDIKIHSSLDIMSIYAFDKVSKGDMRYLIVGFEDDGEEIEMPEGTDIVWGNLYTEYCELMGNSEALMIFVLACEVNYLEMRELAVSTLLAQLTKGKPQEILKEYYEELREWGFKVDESKEYDVILDNIMLQLRASGNKLRRKKSEYKDLTKKDDDYKETTLIQQKVSLHLNSKINIDLKTTTVTEWMTYWSELDKQNNEIKRRYAKH